MKISMTITALAGAAVLAQAAHAADTVQMRFKQTGLGTNIKMSVNGGEKQSVFAGQLLHEFANGTGLGASLTGVKPTYCTDLFQHVTSSWKVYEIKDVANMPTPAMGAAKANAIADVYRFGVGAVDRGELDNSMAAALQIAIWEIVTDFDINLGRSALDVGAGMFKAFNSNSSNLSGAVVGYLNDIFDTVGESTHHNNLLGLANGSSQDQLLDVPSVPLPSASGLAAAGLLGLAGTRRRRATV